MKDYIRMRLPPLPQEMRRELEGKLSERLQGMERTGSDVSVQLEPPPPQAQAAAMPSALMATPTVMSATPASAGGLVPSPPVKVRSPMGFLSATSRMGSLSSILDDEGSSRCSSEWAPGQGSASSSPLGPPIRSTRPNPPRRRVRTERMDLAPLAHLVSSTALYNTPEALADDDEANPFFAHGSATDPRALFESATAPTIPVWHFMETLSTIEATPRHWHSTALLTDALSRALDMPLSDFNVHRVLLAAFTKAFVDVRDETVTRVADAAGVPAAELQQMVDTFEAAGVRISRTLRPVAFGGVRARIAAPAPPAMRLMAGPGCTEYCQLFPCLRVDVLQ